MRLAVDDHPTERMYPQNALAEALAVDPRQVADWIASGLLTPTHRDGDECYFDFPQIARARTLVELSDAGVTVARIRRSIDQLRRLLPPDQDPLQHLTGVSARGRLLVRMGDGELAEVSGQLNFDFLNEAEPIPLPGQPRDKSEWHASGVRKELDGDLTAAVNCYSQALLVGGPDARVCFDLAHALGDCGEHERAIERYMQTIEIDPGYVDAWNNLGVLLAETGKRAEACVAFEGALVGNPADARAHYNLADTLEELGRADLAAAHWRAYLSGDSFKLSEHATHARARLSATTPGR
jgi:tetratricopeptide (TPR) repeat protein